MDLHQPFLIDHRFLIDPSRHRIRDLETQSETRLELRHINLLSELCRNRGKLVERNFLIKEIWNEYSGADEALTQSISVLRKLLADDKKELIQTIPKKGYIFQAEISPPQPPSSVRDQPARRKYSRVWLYGLLAGIGILAMLLILRQGGGRQDVGKKFQYAPAAKPVPEQKRVKSGNVADVKFHYIPAPETKRSQKRKNPTPEGPHSGSK